MKLIFDLVTRSLLTIGKWTHLTYNEINIIVYYLLIPLSWCIMADCIFKRPYLSILCTAIWACILIVKHSCFSEWCDRAFRASVDFLLWFGRIGWNYTVASVIICVVVPLMIYGILIWQLVKSHPVF